MFYHPDLFVYIWLLPVALWLIFPVIVSAGSLLFGRSSFGLASQRTTYLVEQELNHKEFEVLDKREHPRFRIADIVAHVSDGNNSCASMPCNISRFGIGIMNLPEKIFDQTERLSVIISGHEKKFKMNLKPKWDSESGSATRLGGVIDNVPAEWLEFVNKYERIFHAEPIPVRKH